MYSFLKVEIKRNGKKQLNIRPPRRGLRNNSGTAPMVVSGT